MVTGGPNAEIRGESYLPDIVNASEEVKWENGGLTSCDNKHETEAE
jgi:hypothetical protein